MPLTYVQSFRVRHYECDGWGALAPATYLRYMQEAAFGASAAAGYDVPRYRTMGRSWLIRESDVQYLRAAHHGDSVEVETWVADFRRVRSRRAYEFRLAGSGTPIARAHTDWAFLDSTSGRPTAIPLEMIVAFYPEGLPQSAPPRLHFTSPPPPADAYRRRRRVEWSDLDPAQHVNNAVHLALVESCGVEAAETVGWPMGRLQASGVRIRPIRDQIEYLQPAFLGEELEYTTWYSDLVKTAAVRHCTVARLGEPDTLVRARTVWGCVDLETEQTVALPDAFLADLAQLCANPTRCAKGRT